MTRRICGKERDLNIAFVLDFYSPHMGYVSNFLPQQISKLGVNVTIITKHDYLQPYLTGEIVSESVHWKGGYVEIVISDTLRFFGVRGRLTPIGWQFSNLKDIFGGENFSVVQSIVITTSILNYQVYRLAKKLNIPLCLQDHSSKSAFHSNFRGKSYIKFVKYVFARKYNNYIERCYVPSPDIIDVVSNWYGISHSLVYYEPLGVNDDWFHLPKQLDMDEAMELRRNLDISKDRFIVLYTGRLTEKKGAPQLAIAISRIFKSNNRIMGLFVGKGNDDEISFIESKPGCKVIPMQKASDLPKYYWAANAGAWPREGSTSILDAMACGLPAIVRSGLTEPERRPYSELIFEEDNVEDLQRVIVQLESEPRLKLLGEKSSEMILKNHTWKRIAQQRVEYYESLVLTKDF